jgi:uncharacterized protein (DUF983 family)
MSGEDSAGRPRKESGADAKPEGTKAHLDAKRLLARCEACDLDVKWLVAEDVYLLQTVIRPGQKRPIGMPLHAAICPSCGHVRLFHTGIPG